MKTRVFKELSYSVAAFALAVSGLVFVPTDTYADGCEASTIDGVAIICDQAGLETALSGDAATIKFGANLATTKHMTISRDVTIDLNGFTLDGSGSSSKVAFLMSNGAHVTMRNGKIEKANYAVQVGNNAGEPGYLTVEAGTTLAANTSAVRVVKGGVTVNGGTATGGQRGVDLARGSYLVLNDGNIIGNGAAAISTKEKSTVTIKGGHVEDTVVSAINVKEGTITMDGGTVAAPNGSGVVVYNDSSFVMNGGEIVAKNFATGGNGTMKTDSSNYGANANITINDGTLTSDNYAIYFPQGGDSTLTINGGVITGAAGAVAINNGKMKVTGGTLKSLGTVAASGDASLDGTRGYGSAVIANTAEYGEVPIEVTGGTFLAEGNAEIFDDFGIGASVTTKGSDVAVSGGVFNKEIDESYIVTGMDEIDLVDGMVVVAKKTETTVELSQGIKSELTNEEAAAIADVLKHSTDKFAAYYEVAAYLKDASGATLGEVSELDESQEFTLAIPNDLQVAADGSVRNFYVIRYHEGVAEVIDSKLSDDGTYLTVQSDKFSTYVLAYYDVEAETVTSGEATLASATTNPNTLDNGANYIVMAGAAAAVMAGAIIYLMKQEA